MKTIILSNMKGGTGKTSTAVSLASGLYNKGKRVLLIDADPQCNACFMLGQNVLEAETTLMDVFKGAVPITEAIYPVALGYDISMCGLQGAAADITFTSMGREQILAEALTPIQDKYDYVVVDTGPSLGILTTSAMAAADYLIIPVTADPLAIQGATQLDAYIANVRKYCNPGLKVMGLLITMYNQRNVLTKSLEGAIHTVADNMGTAVFDTRIRRAQALQDAQSMQRDIYTAATKSTATQDYTAFVDEVIERMATYGTK